MALWNTFLWSDGTLWADAHGPVSLYSAEINRSAYLVSMRFTYTLSAPPGSLSASTIHHSTTEIGARPQVDDGYVAFIDRNDTTQRISVRITNTSTGVTTDPFVVDHIHMLANRRSRSQPTN